jgi:hypothetical protein
MNKEQKDRLLAMTEIEAANLPRAEWYSRVRILREKICMEALKNNHPSLAYQKEKKIEPRASNELIEAPSDWRDKL